MTQLWLALDTDWNKAESIARQTYRYVDAYKIGLKLFVKEGPSIVSLVKELGKPVFLDLKFHDIPNTVRGASQSAIDIGANYFSIHLAAGATAAKWAVAAASTTPHTVEPVGITVLTSETRAENHREKLLERCYTAWQAGIKYVVMSVSDLEMIGNEQYFSSFRVICPGIRPAGHKAYDQKRVATPARAREAGAFAVVVGRPILESEPASAAKRIKEELAG